MWATPGTSWLDRLSDSRSGRPAPSPGFAWLLAGTVNCALAPAPALFRWDHGDPCSASPLAGQKALCSCSYSMSPGTGTGGSRRPGTAVKSALALGGNQLYLPVSPLGQDNKLPGCSPRHGGEEPGRHLRASWPFQPPQQSLWAWFSLRFLCLLSSSTGGAH